MVYNLHEQQAFTYFQFSDLAKNWHLCTPVIVNILYPHPSIQKKVFIYKESFEKTSVVTKIGSEVGAYMNYDKITYKFC